MNAHHQKRSYRHSLPAPVEFVSLGEQLSIPSQERESEGKRDRVWTGIERVPFGSQLDLVLPALGSSPSARLPAELEDLINAEARFQVVRRLNLGDLLAPAFLNDYVRKGSLIGLSVGGDDGDDVLCIDGRGRLILHLNKDSYELLGLPGRPSAYGAHRQSYVVEIDLRDPSFRAGKKGFERTKRILAGWPRKVSLFDEIAGVRSAPTMAEGEGKGRTFDVLFAFVDEHGQSQPISFPPGVNSTSHAPTSTSHSLPSILLPPSPYLPPRPTQPSIKKARVRLAADDESLKAADDLAEWEEKMEAFREWLGFARVGAAEKLRATTEGEEKGEKGDVGVWTWQGFWHPAVARRVVEKTLALLDDQPFVSLSLTLPPNSPLSHLPSNQVLATRKRPSHPASTAKSAGTAKRGRGTGEEDERDLGGEGAVDVSGGGWELVLERERRWAFWEGQ